jgi:hypothetical protein
VGKRIANALITFVSEDALIDPGPGSDYADEDLLVMPEDHSLAGGQVAQALIPRRRRQPGTHAIGIFDPVNVLKQA